MKKFSNRICLMAYCSLLMSCSSPKDSEASDLAITENHDDAEKSGNEHDRELIKERGWLSEGLNFSEPEIYNKESEEPQTVGKTPLQNFGPFRLGMTLESVRMAARIANLNSSVLGNLNNDGWCSPPIVANGRGVVLAPRWLGFIGSCSPGKRCSSYDLEFSPVANRLRTTYIRQNSSDIIKIKKESLNPLSDFSNQRAFFLCELTSLEDNVLLRWDAMENLTIRGKFGKPNLKIETIPPHIREYLRTWEKSTTVPCNGDADCYAVSPRLNGSWRYEDKVIAHYTLNVNGFGVYWFEYIIVFRGEEVIWRGFPKEFAEHGFAGEQRTVEQALADFS